MLHPKSFLAALLLGSAIDLTRVKPVIQSRYSTPTSTSVFK
jgi:hypothetical protein